MDGGTLSQAPWRLSEGDAKRRKEEASRVRQDRQEDVVLFRKVFGADDATRTPEQARIISRLKQLLGVDLPVFRFVPGQPTDPFRAANSDGRRDAFFTIMDFIKTETKE